MSRLVSCQHCQQPLNSIVHIRDGTLTQAWASGAALWPIAHLVFSLSRLPNRQRTSTRGWVRDQYLQWVSCEEH